MSYMETSHNQEREYERETTVHSVPSDITSQIIAYEENELDEEQVIALFQSLVDTGIAWQLQGSYGRTAQRLIDAGYVNAD